MACPKNMDRESYLAFRRAESKAFLENETPEHRENRLALRSAKWKAAHPRTTIIRGVERCRHEAISSLPCRECKEHKSLSEFDIYTHLDRVIRRTRSGRKPSYRSECKKCRRLIFRRKRREFLAANPEWSKEYHKRHYSEVAEKVKARTKARQYGPKRDEILAYMRKRYKEQDMGAKRRASGYFRDYFHKTRAQNPLLRIRDACRARLQYIVKSGHKKLAKSWELIGCSLLQLRDHLEAQFKPGMTWEKHGKGKGKWNIDHIVPVAFFDLRTLENQRACFHYTNLQPLWEPENMKKWKHL